jgi:hypothetical protein
VAADLGAVEIDAVRLPTQMNRNGKGTVFFFASGNEGEEGTDANDYSVQRTPWVINVGALGRTNRYSPYSNPGANVLISSYGGDTTIENGGMYGAYAAWANNAPPPAPGNCGYNGQGTSYATPVAAGVALLMLQANPNLTYRDVMQILVQTATPYDSNTTVTALRYQTNGGGHLFSHGYGFGAVNAIAAVGAARIWRNKPALIISPLLEKDVGADAATTPVTSTINVAFTGRVEHVVISVDITTNDEGRGGLNLTLTSPFGTVAYLHHPRNETRTNLTSTQLMAVTFWDENPAGNWTLSLSTATVSAFTTSPVVTPATQALLVSWGLTVYYYTPPARVFNPCHYYKSLAACSTLPCQWDQTDSKCRHNCKATWNNLADCEADTYCRWTGTICKHKKGSRLY